MTHQDATARAERLAASLVSSLDQTPGRVTGRLGP